MNAYLTAMVGRFGLDHAAMRERFGSEMLAAEMCCAACRQTERCSRFLAGAAGSEAPTAFCPNARLLDTLREAS